MSGDSTTPNTPCDDDLLLPSDEGPKGDEPDSSDSDTDFLPTHQVDSVDDEFSTESSSSSSSSSEDPPRSPHPTSFPKHIGSTASVVTTVKRKVVLFSEDSWRAQRMKAWCNGEGHPRHTSLGLRKQLVSCACRVFHVSTMVSPLYKDGCPATQRSSASNITREANKLSTALCVPRRGDESCVRRWRHLWPVLFEKKLVAEKKTTFDGVCRTTA